MKNQAIKNIKEVFESDNAIITKIMQGLNGQVRIDAKTRYHQADKNNFFSNWCTEKYANKLAVENYGKKINEFNCYQY